MFHYHAFGLNIRSDIELSGVQSIDAFVGEDEDVVEIRCESVPKGIPGLDGGDDLVGVAKGLLRCRITRGRRIVVEIFPEADRELIRTMLVGELMAAILRQRGYLVLHGAAVAHQDGAIGFIGNSGWGKSTLATYFSRNGYTLFTDDVLAIDVRGEEALVVPGPAHVKLLEDVGSLFIENFEALDRAHGGTEKRLAVHTETTERAPTPLRKLYILEKTPTPDAAITELGRKAAFVELLRHTRAMNLINAPAYRAKHLEQCGRLLSRVPVGILHRPRALERLPEIAELVEEDIGVCRP